MGQPLESVEGLDLSPGFPDAQVCVLNHPCRLRWKENSSPWCLPVYSFTYLIQFWGPLIWETQGRTHARAHSLLLSWQFQPLLISEHLLGVQQCARLITGYLQRSSAYQKLPNWLIHRPPTFYYYVGPSSCRERYPFRSFPDDGLIISHFSFSLLYVLHLMKSSLQSFTQCTHRDDSRSTIMLQLRAQWRK